VGLSVYPPLFARQLLGKHVSAAVNNCWMRHFLCGPLQIIPTTFCYLIGFVTRKLVDRLAHTHKYKGYQSIVTCSSSATNKCGFRI
jgi:hypothetical protein